jgi:hypothetical protein
MHSRTQKNAPQVPLTGVSFMPARKLPYRKSFRSLVISAMGINPLSGTPPRTISCTPGSPPRWLSSLEPSVSLSGLVTTLAGEASLP